MGNENSNRSPYELENIYKWWKRSVENSNYSEVSIILTKYGFPMTKYGEVVFEAHNLKMLNMFIAF